MVGRRLARAVRRHGLRLVDDERGVARDIQDAAALAGIAHPLADLIGHVHGSVQIRIDDAVPVAQLLVHVQQLAHAADAGVVHEDVDAPETLAHQLHRFPDALYVRDVTGKALVFSAVLREFLERFGGFLFVAAENGDIRPALCHGGSNPEAQAAVSSRDHRVLSLQAESVAHVFDCLDHMNPSCQKMACFLLCLIVKQQLISVNNTSPGNLVIFFQLRYTLFVDHQLSSGGVLP